MNTSILNKNYNTYFLSGLFDRNDVVRLRIILKDTKIKILNITVYDSLPHECILELESILNNLPYHLEYLLILHNDFIAYRRDFTKYNKVIQATNLPIFLKKIFINNKILLNIKIPFDCQLIDITETYGQKEYFNLIQTIKPYN
jgi:hypothetical protein